MSTCLICWSVFESSPLLPCSCEICELCLVSYIEITIPSEKFDLKLRSISCPSDKCLQSLNIEDLLKKINNRHYRSSIDNLLLQKYLREKKDVLNCPTLNCDYYGFIKFENCTNALQCEKCGSKWLNPQLLPFPHKLLYNVKNLMNQRNEWLSGIYEEFFTKECPKCGIAILKNGGCKHMTCKKCNYEFCWICTHFYGSHAFDVCKWSGGMKYGTFLLVILLILWKVSLIGTVIAWIWFGLYFMFKYVLLCNGYVYSVFVSFNTFYINLINPYVFQKGGSSNFNSRRQSFIWKSQLAISLFFSILFSIIFFFFDWFVGLVLFLFAEIIFALTGVGIVTVYNHIWTAWLSLVT